MSATKNTAELTLAVLACGTMGTAILTGVLDTRRERAQNNGVSQVDAVPQSSLVDELVPLPRHIVATVGRPETKRRLEQTMHDHGFDDIDILVQTNVEAARRADVVLLCCKPQRVGEVLDEEGMREALDGKMLVSIIAGVTIEQLTTHVLPSTTVVRAMPNTPSKIREGMTVVSLVRRLTQQDRNLLSTIFSAVGMCRFLDEKYFDAATALAGSGPAFVTLFLEAMADGGVMKGLPRAEALELAAQSTYPHDPLTQRCRAPRAWCCRPACTPLPSRTASRLPVAAPLLACSRWRMAACALRWHARSRLLPSTPQASATRCTSSLYVELPRHMGLLGLLYRDAAQVRQKRIVQLVGIGPALRLRQFVYVRWRGAQRQVVEPHAQPHAQQQWEEEYSCGRGGADQRGATWSRQCAVQRCVERARRKTRVTLDICHTRRGNLRSDGSRWCHGGRRCG